MIEFTKHKYLGVTEKPMGGWNYNNKLVVGEVYEILAGPHQVQFGQNGNGFGIETSIGFIEYDYPRVDRGHTSNQEDIVAGINADWESVQSACLVLLDELVASEDSACDFDHHGNCQEHNSWREDNTCVVHDARKILSLPVGVVVTPEQETK